MLSLSLNPGIQTTQQKQTLTLPDELFLLVLRFLPPEDLPRTCLVCRDWTNLSIEAGRVYYRNVTIALGGKRIVAKSGLKDMRSFALLIQKRATLNQDVDNSEKWYVLTSIVSQFTEAGDFEDALETSYLISNQERRSASLSSIFKHILAKKGTQVAVDLALKIPDDMQKSKSLFSILTTHLTKLGDVKSALQIAHTMPDNLSKASALSFISKDLAAKGSVSEALQIAKEALTLTQEETTEQSGHRCQTLQNVSEDFLHISKQFANKRDIDEAFRMNLKALEIARLIEDKACLARALLGVSNSMKVIRQNLGAFLAASEALDAANLIIEGPSSPKSNTLLRICEAFVSLNHFKKAQEVAYSISFLHDRSRALLLISKGYATRGNLSDAVRLAEESLALASEERNSGRRDSIYFLISKAYLYISKKFSERTEIATKAQTIADRIGDETLRSKALSDICI